LNSASAPIFLLLGLSVLPAAAAIGACSSKNEDHPPTADAGDPADAARLDAATEAAADATNDPTDATAKDAPNPPTDAPAMADVAPPPAGSFCALPGSYIWSDQGFAIVPGATGPAHDLSFLKLPAGFCAHYFGTVMDARQLRFAPGGELFVASPRTGTTGGVTQGALGGIAVLPDDNGDGVADQNLVFLPGLDSVQGLLFANAKLYYQDGSTIRSVAYTKGDRAPSAAPEVVTTFTADVAIQDSLHWPKVMDIATDGTIYITNGGSQGDLCLASPPRRGAIFSLQADGGVTLVSKGYRNPIAIKCETDHAVCLAAELALDYSNSKAGREKVVPVRAGDDWGFPCCATKDTPYGATFYEDGDGGVPDCSGVAPESDSFIIGRTPFGIDFESGKWPAPWTRSAFVTLHGAAGSLEGARVVALAIDPSTGMPLPGSDLPGVNTGSLLDFATGWDDGTRAHGRPAPITFAPDGRMFLGDDNKGLIVWIAPYELSRN
jgi:glucose/arabinose dehydrogenase